MAERSGLTVVEPIIIDDEIVDLTAVEPANTGDDVVVIEDDGTDNTVEVTETAVEAGTTAEVIEIDDLDEEFPEVIEIEEDMFELSESGQVYEHRGQHISIVSGVTCEKCAKLMDIDPATEEHTGNHSFCKKCDEIN